MESISITPSANNPESEVDQKQMQQTTGWEEVAAMANDYNRPSVDIEEILGRSLPNKLLDEENPYTPQINELKATGVDIPFLKREAERIQSNISYNPDYKMDESEMVELSSFFENPKIPQEDKNTMLNCIGEEFREFYFERFFNNFSNNIIQAERQKQHGAVYETPMDCEVPYRVNGVPVPEFMMQTSLGQFKVFLSCDELSDAQKNDGPLLLMAQYVTSNEDYFKSPLVTQNVSKRLAWLKQSSPAVNQAKEHWAAERDKEHFREIESSIDYESNTSINPKLKELLLKDMPEDYSNLEKSIYAYLKLCDTLSYDGIYYKDGDNQGVHLNSARISDIDSENNKIVCYEFTRIFESMLNDFGINYEKHSNIDQAGNFSNSHSNTTYLVDDMIMFADSTRTVEQGDLVNVKLREKTNGIRCENYTKEKQEHYSKAYEKVRAHIDEESERVAYASIIKRYNELKKSKHLTIADKINYMFSELNQTNLTGMDLFSAENLLETHILKSVEGIKKALVVDGEKMAIQFTLSTKDRNPKDATIAVFSYDLNTKELKKEYSKEEFIETQTGSNFVSDNPETIKQIFGE